MKRFFQILALACSLACGASAVPAQNFAVKTHTLKNGMKIIVQEDNSIPSVALYIFYRIGSRNERPGTTGLSHFFEHMMFNGAKKYGPGSFDQVMEANGGANNAYTSNDVTVYQDWFPPTATELIFDLEADRIRDLAFDPKIIESERGVVASERRNGEDSPFGAVFEQLNAAAFTAHPYQWPVVGWMVDIENWKMEDLKEHFKMGYSPSNATMVVAGAVKTEEIVRLAEKYIEPIPSHDPPPPVTTQEPEQQGERRVTIRKEAELPALAIGYHVPATKHPDYYPLDVLTAIALRGQSARLYQRVVDKDQLALSVFGGADTSFDPSLFTIGAQPKAGVAPEAVEKAIYEELDKIKTGGVTEQELAKAKNILLADFYRTMKTINGKANAIGTYEVFFGDYNKLFTAADDYAKVTAADVQRVAKLYFTDKNRTVATLLPEVKQAEANK